MPWLIGEVDDHLFPEIDHRRVSACLLEQYEKWENLPQSECGKFLRFRVWVNDSEFRKEWAYISRIPCVGGRNYVIVGMSCDQIDDFNNQQNPKVLLLP